MDNTLYAAGRLAISSPVRRHNPIPIEPLPQLDEEGKLKDYLFYNMPMAGAAIKLAQGETGHQTLVIGQGVVEYTFSKE